MLENFRSFLEITRQVKANLINDPQSPETGTSLPRQRLE